MKFDSFPEIFLIISVFVPGFIYRAVLGQFVPLRQHNTKELVFLGFLTATAFNYAICAPLIYLLATGRLSANSRIADALAWFVIIFIVPIFLAVISAFITQKDGFRWLYRLLRLRSISPIPTGWDWILVARSHAISSSPCPVVPR
jgi:hypothetical protein